MTARTRRRRRNAESKRAQAPRLIGYCRVSSDEQARNGVSMADQAERIEAHAKASGYQLLRIESDRGVSGYKAPEKRPAMKRALAAVKAGDPLTDEEMDALLARRCGLPRASACPHGRPTVLSVTLEELAKQFKRT